MKKGQLLLLLAALGVQAACSGGSAAPEGTSESSAVVPNNPGSAPADTNVEPPAEPLGTQPTATATEPAPVASAIPTGTTSGEPNPPAGVNEPPPAASGSAGGNDSTDGVALPVATLWLAGDSTVQDYPAGNVEGNGGTSLEGWGQQIGQFFKAELTVSNQAIGGRSVSFFMRAVVKDAAGAYQCVDDQGNPLYQLDAAGNYVDTAQWGRIKNGIKAGDFLLIQFGTNDETHTCPRFVSLPDFQADLGIMVDTVRAKGATPLFVTPVSHRSFNGATVNNTLLPYANAMKAQAALQGVEVLDLNLRSVEYFQSAGTTFLATNIFDGGTTHFIRAGAIKIAELVSGEVRTTEGPLAAYLK